MMKLHYNPLSPNARRAWATVMHLELGNKVEMVPVDMGKGDHLKAEFLDLNPNHKVPVLVDGDFKLWESAAICMYLAETTPNQKLWPTTPRGRADVMRWVSWRYRQRPGFERFLDDVAGSSFGKARQHFAAQHEFDRAMESGETLPTFADYADPELLAQVHAPLRLLERRLLLALVVYLGLMLATGAFNLLHGGQPRYLVPALLLHFTWLAHMLLAILQRNRVARWRSAGSIEALRALLESIIKERQRAERWTLTAAPVLLAAAFQVLAKIVAGVSLAALMTPASTTLLALLMAAATVALALRLRGPMGRIQSAAGNAISLGVSVAALRLLTLLRRS